VIDEGVAVDLGFSPRIRRERLAAELRALRGKMTAAQLAAKIGRAQSTITRLETLKSLPDVGLVLDILDALGVVEPKRSELLTLARDGGKRGWWRAFTGMPAAQAGRAELEEGAVTLREYAAVYVPGLLQSRGYALVRFEDRDAYDEFDTDAALAGRQERQRILTRADQPVHYMAILDETIDHLLRAMSLERVTVRVLPFGAEPEHYAFPFTSFSIYEFRDPADPRIVAVETDSSDMHLGDQEDLDRYRLTFERIDAAALDPDQSARLIEGARP
jgi:transcriptional regulator with XRE-family HTH domain